MRRFFAFMLSLILMIPLLCGVAWGKPDWPSDTGIQSEAGIVMDMDSGAVIFAQNIHEAKYPASITKLLTALVVIENASLDEMVTFSYTAMNSVDWDSGNKLDMAEGDVLSVQDCLYLLLLQSSNQTANALAEHVAGSISAFAEMMNARAAELGCTESHFVNPSGLHDEEQYTTAYDMALISRACYENEALLAVASTKSVHIPATINNPEGRTCNMEHRLVVTEDEESEYYYPWAIAGKTGYTLAAGQTLVTYAQRDGRRLVAVTLKSSGRTHYSDTITILDFGFLRFKNVFVADNETAYVTGGSPVSVNGVSYSPTDLYIDPEAVITLPNEASFEDAELTLTEFADVQGHGDGVGLLVYTYNERFIGQGILYTSSPKEDPVEIVEETQAVAGTPAEAMPAEGGTGRAGTVSPKAFFYGVLAVFGLAAVGTVIYLVIRSRKKKEEQRRLRLEKRRRRLADIGCSEEDFAQLVEEKRKGRSGTAKKEEAKTDPPTDGGQ